MLKAHCLQPPSPVSLDKPQPGCEPLLRQWVATGSSNPALLSPIGPLCLSSTLSPGLKGRRDSCSFSLGGGGFDKCGIFILTTASFLVSKHRINITHALSIFCTISWLTQFFGTSDKIFILKYKVISYMEAHKISLVDFQSQICQGTSSHCL